MDTQTNAKIAEKIRLRPELKDWEIVKLLKWLHLKSADVAAVRAKGKGDAPEKPPQVRARSLAEFRKAHDIAQKIRDRLAGMRHSSYVTEEELRQLCEVPVQNWRRNADLPEFSPHKFKLDGTTYWAAVETIKEMKVITGRA
jgi:hypothetical protein